MHARRSLAAFAAVFATAMAPTQDLPRLELREVRGGDGLRFAVQLPADRALDRWAPMLVVFARDDGDREASARAALARLGDRLPRAGWVVVSPVPARADQDLLPMFAELRRGFRVEQGGMHALCDGDEASVERVRRSLHQFQTVTLDGPIDDRWTKSLQGAAARRVRPAAAEDVAGQLLAMHGQRSLAGPARDVARALDDFHDAAANGDGGRYFALLPDDAVFLGTDGAERWTGAGFRAAFAKHFERDTAWTYVALQRRVTLGPGGQIAWFDEVLDNAAYGECRGSGVVVQRDGRWVLQQYNLTIAVPNDLAGAFAARVRALQAAAPEPVATVVLVRHAEKVDDSRDAALSPAGRARAEALATALRDVPVAAVFTSEFVRTKDTVAPLCAAKAVSPQVVAAADPKALVAALRRLDGGRTAVVAGHSNTVPGILRALGVAEPPAIADDEFDHLFVVTLAPEGARCVALRYR